MYGQAIKYKAEGEMGKMAGGIKKIGMSYRVTMELGKDPDGKKLREYATFNNRMEAEKCLNEFKLKRRR